MSGACYKLHSTASSGDHLKGTMILPYSMLHLDHLNEKYATFPAIANDTPLTLFHTALWPYQLKDAKVHAIVNDMPLTLFHTAL